MTRLAFVDTETTGLDPDLHEIWEVGLILRDDGIESEYTWQLPVDLGRADPMALKIGRFHERRWTGEGHVGLDREYVSKAVVAPESMGYWCELFTALTLGAHLVGAVVSFDEERLRRLLRRHGECPMWHYHLVDVEALAAGWVGHLDSTGDIEHAAWGYVDSGAPPWKSDDLSLAVGVDPEHFDRHTALGDARWAKAIYDAVLVHPEATDG